MTERIVRFTKELIEHPFTTEPKSGKRKSYSPIRDRCLLFREILIDMGYDKTVPLEKAKEIFMQNLFMDRATITAYFGSQEATSIRKIRRRATYQSGTVSYKNIELAQDIKMRKGYLEILGLVDIEKKGHTYFLTFKSDGLIPQLEPNNECSSFAIPSFSLTQEDSSLRGKSLRKPILEVVSTKEGVESRQTINNNNHRVREKSGLDFLHTGGSTGES